jgi:hypothetical protein
MPPPRTYKGPTHSLVGLILSLQSQYQCPSVLGNLEPTTILVMSSNTKVSPVNLDDNSHLSSLLGARYKIIQAHTSQVTTTVYSAVWSSSHPSTQGDWAPPVVPALWGRIPDSECQSQGPFNPPDKSTSIIFSCHRSASSFALPRRLLWSRCTTTE